MAVLTKDYEVFRDFAVSVLCTVADKMFKKSLFKILDLIAAAATLRHRSRLSR